MKISPPHTAPRETVTHREAQRRATRDKILRAAAHCFARQGYEATSLSRVAGQARVKKALVQYHFQSKLTLWQAAVAATWALRDRALPRYLSTDTEGTASLHRVLAGILVFTRDHPEWLGLMLQETSRPGPRLDWLIRHYLRDDFHAGQAFVQRAIEDSLVPRGEALNILLMLSGALTYPATVQPLLEQVLGEDFFTPERLTRYIDDMTALLTGVSGVHGQEVPQ